MVDWLEIPGFSGVDDIICGFTKRSGGVSLPPFDALNLSFNRADSEEKVMENFRRLASAIDTTPDKIVRAYQTHGHICKRVVASDAGIAPAVANHLSGVDALVTNERGIILLTTHADCVPVFFHDPEHNAIGLAHAGWGGTLAGVVEETLHMMQNEFGTNLAHLHVAIGPHIQSCCFEVQDDVADRFKQKEVWNDAFAEPTINGNGFRINLMAYLEAVLLNAGVSLRHMQAVEVCTKCQADTYFSHRGSGGNTGCGAAFIGLEVQH